MWEGREMQEMEEPEPADGVQPCTLKAGVLHLLYRPVLGLKIHGLYGHRSMGCLTSAFLPPMH
jgi:hypothetical protein